MTALKQLNQVNDVPVLPVAAPEFTLYGRVITGYDVTGLISYMETRTQIPEHGNLYTASVPDLEADPVIKSIQNGCYGGMEIQAGFCNGRNTTYNGFEYHKGSELNIAVTDFMLVLGHIWEIHNNSFQAADAKVFFIEKNTVVELYQTTLHLSPCRVTDEGFKDIVILPKGTNTPLDHRAMAVTAEDILLLQKNKWMIAHAERDLLIRQGAHAGLIGVNRELHY